MIKYQKVIKVGNSLAVTLDSDFVKKTGIKAGDQMAAAYKPDIRIFSMADSISALDSGGNTSEPASVLAGKINPELEAWTDNFLQENREAMIRLKDL